MRTLASLLIALAVALPALGAPREKAPRGAWISLFDGTTLDGWVRRSGFATFAVEDGTIVGTTADGSGNTFLCTTREFGNFDLRFDVRIDEGLNSGVQVRSKIRSTDEKGREMGFGGLVYGPQVEIESSPGRSGWILGESTGLGWLSPEPNSKDPAVNQHTHLKNGEWNEFRVLADGSRIQTFINGAKVADLTHPDIFQNHTKGFIGLQIQAVRSTATPLQVRWRNLKIRELL